jgi:hypothetical protein
MLSSQRDLGMLAVDILGEKSHFEPVVPFHSTHCNFSSVGVDVYLKRVGLSCTAILASSKEAANHLTTGKDRHGKQVEQESAEWFISTFIHALPYSRLPPSLFTLINPLFLPHNKCPPSTRQTKIPNKGIAALSQNCTQTHDRRL